MKFIIYKNYPYYYDGKNIFPCTVDALGITVDQTTPLIPPEKIECIYSDSEIRLPFGIKRVDSWDGRKGHMVEKSNKTVKSTAEIYGAI